MASFNQIYLELRGNLRKFKRDSLLEAALRTLRAQHSDKFTELQGAPWLILLLVKWVLQDKIMDQGNGRPINQAQFDELRQLLWTVPDRLDAGIGENRPGLLFVRQLLRSQLGFQRPIDPGFVREAALLASLPADHRLRKLWLERTGVDVEDCLALQYVMCSMVLGNTLSFDFDLAFANIEQSFPPNVIPRFLALIGRDVSQLSEYFRAFRDAKEKKLSEFFEFPQLARFPFLRIGSMLHCWHPEVFYRGLEGLVHSVMTEAGQSYIDSFSKLFERHVIAEADSIGIPFYSESDIRRWIGSDEEVPDGLLSFADCNIFIESKAGLFDESVMAVGHLEIFKQKTRALQKAASQTWNASIGLRQASQAPQMVAAAESDFLLIVTNKELSASRGDHLAKMYPAGTLDPKQPEALRHLLLEHIYIVEIADFERMITLKANSALAFSAATRFVSCIRISKAESLWRGSGTRATKRLRPKLVWAQVMK